ncbi:MAG: carbamate kinase [Chloroflexota bacterium]
MPENPGLENAVLVAVGGNALIRDGQQGTIAEQAENAAATAEHVATLVATGRRVLLTHGNGPQVGFILLRSELARHHEFTPQLTLDMAVADSEGGIGFILGRSLTNAMARRGMPDRVACLLTQTIVSAEDPAFAHPTKPIGRAYTPDEAARHISEDGWVMVAETGRGLRRVVPSPHPLRIVETEAVRALLAAGFAVIAGGGGGIPVVERSPGHYQGVEAVVDKDFASAMLASSLGIPTLLLCTSVPRVAIRFGQPDQRWLDRLTPAEARSHLDQGEFPEGSMGPKIRAALEFIDRGGKEAIVTSQEYLEASLTGNAGTHIVKD